MTDGDARIEVRVEPDDGMALVVVEGEIDLVNADQLDEALGRAAGPDAARVVVVDLSSTDYIDSSGFRMLHRAATRGTVRLVVPEDSLVARAVSLAGLPTLMAIVPSIDAALPQP